MILKRLLLPLTLTAGLAAAETPVIVIERSDGLDLEKATNVGGSEQDFGITRETLLWEAAREGDAAAVEEQIAAGADVDYRGPFQATPLLVSIKEGHAGIAALLIGQGADVDARSFRSWPLSLAVENGDLNTARLLVEAGANVEASDEDGHTALMLAARAGNLQLVELFVRNGANINEETHGEDPRNALLLAVEGGHVDVVEYLLESGADTRMKDGTRDVALTYAREQREKLRGILKLLESRD